MNLIEEPDARIVMDAIPDGFIIQYVIDNFPEEMKNALKEAYP